MNNKYTPFYAEMEKDKTPFTLFIDLETKDIYKADHKTINKLYYWITFVLILALIRAMKEWPLSHDYPLYVIAFTIAAIAIGISIGVLFYKGTIGELRPIYITTETIEEYMQEGKRHYRNELLLTGIVIFCSIVFTILFLIYLSLIWLFLSSSSFLFLGSLMCNVSIKRYQLLYKSKSYLK